MQCLVANNQLMLNGAANMNRQILLTVVGVGLLITGCGQGATDAATNNRPLVGSANLASEFLQSNSGQTTQLTDAQFNSLNVFEQYRVANKLYSTLYKGLSVAEFFKLDAGLTSPETVNGGYYIGGLVQRLQTDLPNSEKQRLDLAILGSDLVDTDNAQMLEARYTFSNDKARELPLARIHTYPMSRPAYVQWMAWHLANSILFSPASELDSADMTDVQNIFRRLSNGISNNALITDVVEMHMRSEENWRRFRSPEDNTREMMEVFLGLEDRDADVPAASKACQDWFLTDENQGYKLSFTDFPNTEPQQVLDESVVSCDDFYALVANHSNLLPTIATVLVRYFYAGKDMDYQSNMVDAIVEQQPVTFEQLFSLIIFSEQYLIDNERLRSYEEVFLATAERLRWRTRHDTFRSLASGRGGMQRSNMAEMGWPALSAKLGRVNGVATDSLSFANFHKGLREDLLLDEWRWSRGLGVREQESLDETDERMSQFEYERRIALNKQLKKLTVDELIDYLFLSAALRPAAPIERAELKRLYDEYNFLRHEEERTYINSWSMPSLSRMTFDYISRLSELYYFKTSTGLSELYNTKTGVAQ